MSSIFVDLWFKTNVIRLKTTQNDSKQTRQLATHLHRTMQWQRRSDETFWLSRDNNSLTSRYMSFSVSTSPSILPVLLLPFPTVFCVSKFEQCTYRNVLSVSRTCHRTHVSLTGNGDERPRKGHHILP